MDQAIWLEAPGPEGKKPWPDGFHIFLRFSKALSALLSFVRGCLFGGLGDLELSGFRVSEV